MYYSSYEKAQNHKSKTTNSKYPTYQQIVFTAGDEEQFEIHRKRFSLSEFNPPNNIITNNDVYIPTISPLYSNLSNKDITNTFSYIYHKFKKGLFIKIKDNQVYVALPFSKYTYYNEWSNLISFNPKKYNSFDDLLSKINDQNKMRFNPKSVHHMSKWYANNALIRYEIPNKEGDMCSHVLIDMIQEVCKHRIVPDIEFFINRRDNPILNSDRTEPYNYIFGDNVKLISHYYDKYAPILSMCSNPKSADIPIPTYEDWARVSVLDQKYFPFIAQEYKNNYNFVQWQDKIPIAIFRGTSTGFGLTFDTNMRLKVSKMSLDNVMDEDCMRLLDAGIIRWNLRPRIDPITHNVEIFSQDVLNLPIVSYLNSEQQSKYKYIINIDGHVSAYRLSLELSTGSVILLVDSNNKVWYSNLLKPYVHYIPIKHDLSDLYDQIKFCKRNDELCQEITKNALKFYNTYLCKEYIMDYMQQLLINLHNTCGVYEYKPSVIETLYNLKLKELDKINVLKFEDSIVLTQINAPRSYDLLKAIQMILSIPNIWNENICDVNQTIQNRKTSIQIVNINGFKIAIKECLPQVQYVHQDEFINEAFIGMCCINQLVQFVPNFMYTFSHNDNKLYTEFIDGMTLQDYIASSEFHIYDFFLILVQVFLAINAAQQWYLFVHYDLFPWNIILKKVPKTEVHYYTHDETFITLKTTIIPIIIDFGKSSVVYNGVQYCTRNYFKSSMIVDVLSLMISSMHHILEVRKCSQSEITKLLHLSKFFSGTRFTNNKTFDNLKSLKTFLANNKKFSVLTNSCKYELESKTALTAAEYILRTFKIKFEYTFKNPLSMRNGSCYDWFNKMTSSNIPITCNDIFDEIALNNKLNKDYNFDRETVTYMIDDNISDIVYFENQELDLYTFDDSDKINKLKEYFKSYPHIYKHEYIDLKMKGIYHRSYDYKVQNNINLRNIEYLRNMANKNTFELFSGFTEG